MKKVYNESKTEILTEFDLEKGYLTSDVITTHYPAVQAVEEVGHYEVVREYESGGKDVEYVIDTPAVQAVEEHDETEEIDVYIPYTAAELRKREIDARIAELKRLLSASDYKAIKYAEGLISAEDYAETKAERQAWRDEINALESELSEGGAQ